MSLPSKDETMNFLANMIGEEVRAIEQDYGNGFVRLAVSEAARRQAKHDIRQVEDVVIELLRNARDAGAKTIYVATTTEGTRRTLVVLDDGQGIAEDMWEQIFEPRVTSKLETMRIDEWGVHGRGMALYSIKENVVSVKVASSEVGKGTSLVVEVDSELLPGRADQSTWPTVEHHERGLRIRGPRNIVRTIAEFSFAHPELSVYFGSIPEVISTVFKGEGEQWLGTALQECVDAQDLELEATACGLVTSERTAYRIISGQLAGAVNVREHLAADHLTPETVDAVSFETLEKDSRGLKIDPADLDAFCLDLEKAFDGLGEKYYLDLAGRVDVRHQGDTIRATFRFDKQ